MVSINVLKLHMISFLESVRFELEKVTWPSRENVIRLTGIVLGISIIVGVYIGVVDLILNRILEILIQ